MAGIFAGPCFLLLGIYFDSRTTLPSTRLASPGDSVQELLSMEQAHSMHNGILSGDMQSKAVKRKFLCENRIETYVLASDAAFADPCACLQIISTYLINYLLYITTTTTTPF